MKHAKRARTAYLRRVVSRGPLAYMYMDIKRFNQGMLRIAADMKRFNESMLEAAAEIARLLRVRGELTE